MKEKKLTIRKDFFKKNKIQETNKFNDSSKFSQPISKSKVFNLFIFTRSKKKKKPYKEYSKTCNLGIGLTLKFVQMYVKETAEKFSAKPRRVSEMNSDIWSVE